MCYIDTLLFFDCFFVFDCCGFGCSFVVLFCILFCLWCVLVGFCWCLFWVVGVVIDFVVLGVGVHIQGFLFGSTRFCILWTPFVV